MLAVALLAVGIGQTNAGHAILRDAGLFGPPAAYTSLAFRDPASLPQQLTNAQADIKAPFVIKNNDSATHDYRWSVQLIEGGRTHRTAAGSVAVAAGRTISVNVAAKVSCTNGQVQLTVSLADPAESIDALTACWSPEK